MGQAAAADYRGTCIFADGDVGDRCARSGRSWKERSTLESAVCFWRTLIAKRNIFEGDTFSSLPNIVVHCIPKQGHQCVLQGSCTCLMSQSVRQRDRGIVRVFTTANKNSRLTMPNVRNNHRDQRRHSANPAVGRKEEGTRAANHKVTKWSGDLATRVLESWSSWIPRRAFVVLCS